MKYSKAQIEGWEPEKVRPSQQANRRGSTQLPQGDHIEGEVPTCSHPIFGGWGGTGQGGHLQNIMKSIMRQSVYCLRSGVSFLRTQGWHRAASVNTQPELILRKPRAQYWVAQRTTGQRTSSDIDLFWLSLHGKLENRLPQLRQVLHQGALEHWGEHEKVHLSWNQVMNSWSRTSAEPRQKTQSLGTSKLTTGRSQGASTRPCISQMPSETETKATAEVCNSKRSLIEGVKPGWPCLFGYFNFFCLQDVAGRRPVF